MGVLRQYQHEENEHAIFQNEPVELSLVTAARSKVAWAQMTTTQRAQEQAFFAVFHDLPRYRGKVPAEGSIWKIQFIMATNGRPTTVPEAHWWRGEVRSMKESEREATGGNVLLFCMRPKGAQEMPATSSFNAVRNNTALILKAILHQVVNTTVVKRTLTAIEEVCYEPNAKFDSVRIPLIFAPERFTNNVDLVLDHMHDDGDARAVNEDRWTVIMEMLGPWFTTEQLQLFRNFRRLPGPLNTVVGGFGCGKTTTMARATIAFTLLGHRVQVVAVENTALDNFTEKCDSAKYDLANLAINNGRFDIAQLIIRQKYLRFVPPAVDREMQTVDSEEWDRVDESIEQGTTINVKNQERTPWKDDTKYQDISTLWHKQNQLRQDSEHQLASERLADIDRQILEARIARNSTLMDEYVQKHKQIKREYEYSLGKDKDFNYPASASLAYHVKELKKSQAAGKVSDPKLVEALTNHSHAQSSFAALTGTSPDGDRRRATALLDDTTQTVSQHVLKLADVLVITYITAQHRVFKGCFGPTITIHEESSKTPVGTALCGFTEASNLQHLFLGDNMQNGPMVKSVQDEMFHFSQKSILDLVLLKYGSNPIRLQYRSDPSLSEFPIRYVYGGKMSNAAATKPDDKYKNIWRQLINSVYDLNLDRKGAGREHCQLVGINVVNSVSTAARASSSLVNHASAAVIVNLCRLLTTTEWEFGGEKFRVSGDMISVLSFYKAQTEYIRSLLKGLGVDVRESITVDAAQGLENYFVLVDLVSTGHTTSDMVSAIGASNHVIDLSYVRPVSPYCQDVRRWNVALTRGMKGVAVVANLRTVATGLTDMEETKQRHTMSKFFKRFPEKRTRDFVPQPIPNIALDCIHDLVTRGLVVEDLTEDGNTRGTIKESNLAALAKAQANQRVAESYLWHTRIQERLTVSEYKDEEEHHGKYATYAGPGQRKRFGAFPSALEHLLSARAAEVGNKKAIPLAAYMEEDGPVGSGMRVKAKSRGGKKHRKTQD